MLGRSGKTCKTLKKSSLSIRILMEVVVVHQFIKALY